MDKLAHQRHTGPAAAAVKMAGGGTGKFSNPSGKGRERRGKDSDDLSSSAVKVVWLETTMC